MVNRGIFRRKEFIADPNIFIPVNFKKRDNNFIQTIMEKKQLEMFSFGDVCFAHDSLGNEL